MQQFLRYGYAGSSMDRIAAAAGVSKATVYSHFRDKEGLFAALIQQMAVEKMALMDREHFGEGSARELLQRILAQGVGQLEEDDEYGAFIRLIIGESGRFPQLARLFVENISKPGVDRLTQLLAAHPQVQCSDPEATARIVIGAVVHYKLIQDILHGRDIMPLESDRIIQALVNLICGAPAQVWPSAGGSRS